MSDPKPELIKCTRCRSKLLMQYFTTNRQGELYKLCNNCRHSTDEFKNEIVFCEACGRNYNRKQIYKHNQTRKHYYADAYLNLQTESKATP